MIDFPGSKINLGLQVNEKLDNGYHLLESIFLPTNFTDVLEINPIESEGESKFHFHGIEIPGYLEDNLIHKAHRLILRDFNIPPIEVHLLKNIPMGSGLGGGSADASSMLKLINAQFDLSLSTKELERYAKMLGADCPFFIHKNAAFVEGIGEKITPLQVNLNGKHLAIICSEAHISTKEAFANIQPIKREQKLIDLIESHRIEEWKEHIVNDFEDYAFHLHPQLEMIKNELYQKGALYASMSGTGSSIYGIFNEKLDLGEDLEQYRVYWQDL